MKTKNVVPVILGELLSEEVITISEIKLAEEVYNVIEILEKQLTEVKIFERVLNILQHDRWYKQADRDSVRIAALNYRHLTIKQVEKIISLDYNNDSDNDYNNDLD